MTELAPTVTPSPIVTPGKIALYPPTPRSTLLTRHGLPFSRMTHRQSIAAIHQLLHLIRSAAVENSVFHL